MKEWNARSNPRWFGRASGWTPRRLPHRGTFSWRVGDVNASPAYMATRCCRGEAISPRESSAVRRASRQSANSLPQRRHHTVKSSGEAHFRLPHRGHDALVVHAVTDAQPSRRDVRARRERCCGGSAARQRTASEATRDVRRRRRGPPCAMRSQRPVMMSWSATRCGENPRSTLVVPVSRSPTRVSVEPARITINLREYRSVRKRTQ